MNDIIKNINRLTTTKLGEKRIRENINIESVDNVVDWCKEKILDKSAIFEQVGKNWYVTVGKVQITINSFSYTIITAHKLQSK